jgi:hypothetical protein
MGISIRIKLECHAHSHYMEMDRRFDMTPGELVKAVSIALDVPEETVVQHDRNLVVAGLRTKGGRGSAAPTVTPRDAARLVAAVMGSSKVKDSVSVVQSLEAARATGKGGYPRLEFPLLAALSPNHSFVDGLTALIDEAITPQMFEDFPSYARRFEKLWINVRDRAASIVFLTKMSNEHGIDYWKPQHEGTPTKRDDEGGLLDPIGVRQDRRIRGNRLMMLGRFFQQDEPSSAEAVFRSWQKALKKAAA